MRFWVGSRLLKMMHGVSRRHLGPMLSGSDGNVALSFALISIPL